MDTKNIKLCLMASFLFSISLWVNAQEEFTSTQVKKYKNGIFEVVTLRLKDNTQYKEDFPHDLIPFQIRNDKYHSLGTAFLIDDKTFASAAHVFAIGQTSLLSDNYALRDTQGNIFEIDKVQKFSNYRDIIQFTVKQSTKDYFTFQIADDYEAGDTIYAAGNALGEGVIFRKGTLTSFTFEPVNGLWKDIRFSAAASPGNSGGPLLNLNGEVVGVVTKKSNNENLNYAFPIKEYTEFGNENAEFFLKQMGEVESSKRLNYAWKDSIELPKNIIELRRLAEKSLLERFKSGRKEFVEKYQNEIFPKHPNVAKYIRNQGNHESLAIIDVNGNGEWFLYEPEEESQIKIKGKQSLWYSQTNRFLGAYQFFMEKPEDTSLSAFIQDPKLILDTFLVSVQWNRTVMNTPVYITSMGEPVYTEKHKDLYGRVWTMAVWEDTYADQGVLTYCLPMPRGVVCDMVVSHTGQIDVVKNEYTNNLHRIMLSYTAKLKEWSEFLALDDDMIPEHLHNAKVETKGAVTKFKLGEFSGTVSDIGLNENSSLYVAIEIDVDDMSELVVGLVSFQPNLNEDNLYSVSKFYDLKDDSSESYADFWNKFVKQQTPYDFNIVDEGEIISKKLNLGASGKTPVGEVKAEEGIGYMATCKNESTLGEKHLDTACDSFINGLNKLR